MKASGIGFATDLQTYATAPPEWVHIFPTGQWKRPDDKAWEITEQTLRDFKANFEARAIDQDVPLDTNHTSGPAPGWIRELKIEPNGLWARVEWTPYGQTLVETKQYRYVSPEWYWEFTRPRDGAVFQNVLTCLALTNRPFFEELTPMTASQHTIVGVQDAPRGTPLTYSDANQQVADLAKASCDPAAGADGYMKAVRTVLQERPDLAQACGYGPRPGPERVTPRPGLTPEQASAEIDRMASAAAGPNADSNSYMAAVRAVCEEHPDLLAAYEHR